MSPVPRAAACLSSNQDPASGFTFELGSLPLKPASSFTPRKATFITWPDDLIAVTACTRQWSPGGSGMVPVIVLVAGSPLPNTPILSQPRLETSSEPHLPPPVILLLSESIATARTVESGL